MKRSRMSKSTLPVLFSFLLFAAAASPQSRRVTKDFSAFLKGNAWFEETPEKKSATDVQPSSVFALRALPAERYDPIGGELWLSCGRSEHRAIFKAYRIAGDSEDEVLLGGKWRLDSDGTVFTQVFLEIDGVRSMNYWERDRSLTTLTIDDDTMKAILNAKVAAIGFYDLSEHTQQVVFRMASIDSSRVTEVCGFAPKK